MKISINVNNTIFNINSDNYDIKIMPDYERYGNGYIELNKVWYKDTKLAYLSTMLCKHPRPFRFWFSKKHTKIMVNGLDIDIMDFCKNVDNYHVISFKVNCLKYKLKGDLNLHTRLEITELNVEED